MTKIFTTAKRTPGGIRERRFRYRGSVRRRPSYTLSLGALLVAVAAVAGLLPAAGNGAESAFRRAVFARGFDNPVLLTHAPGDPRAVYVVEQTGRVIRLQGGQRRVLLDIRRNVEFGGEQGLLGLAFHPGYARNRLFYVAYTSNDGRNVVARYRSRSRKAVPGSRKILLSVPDPYGNHNGGHLVFGPDRLLYTTIGDGGSAGDPEERSQNMDSLFGKLLTLDVSKANAKWQIAALGLRNAWRFTFDRATGDLYIGDVGQNAIEEVDFLPRQSPGLENFGWDLYEGSRRHEEGEPSTGRLVFPVFEYRNPEQGCSVTGGYVYRGRARPADRGRYVFGDYCEGTVWSFRVSSGEARDVRTEPFRIGTLTSFGENAAGELFATSADGVIYRIS
jgi:glucose/arabinose dehydrogenase